MSRRGAGHVSGIGWPAWTTGLAAIIVSLSTTASAQPTIRKPSMLEQVYPLLESGDSFQAVELIERQEDPLKVAGTYHNLLRAIYSNKRDLPRMIWIGRSGIGYCLAEAARQPADDSQRANQLKGMAKTIAYDLSANAWPGWEEPGIEVTPSDLLAGLDAARLNLRLARELDRSAEVLGHAHWLLGAQLLARGETDAAIEQFNKSAEAFEAADKPDGRQMSLGYAAIARLTADPADAMARAKLAESIAALKQRGGDDATFFAEQLESVNNYFARHPPRAQGS